MKKLICLILTILITFTSYFALAEYDDIKVILNGEEVQFDQKPIMAEGDRVLVPVRFIAEKFGAIIGYEEETQTVVANIDETVIVLQIGSNEMHINGEIKTLDVPAMEINGRTLIPVRAFAEAFNCQVDWIEEEQTVIIKR